MDYVLTRFEFVLGAAIRAHGVAGISDIQKHARMRSPQCYIFSGAVQRQVFCRDFDLFLGCHVFPLPNPLPRGDGTNSNQRQPICMFGRFACDHIKELGLKFFRHWAALACTNRTVIQLADRRDFGRGAGKEGFIS